MTREYALIPMGDLNFHQENGLLDDLKKRAAELTLDFIDENYPGQTLTLRWIGLHDSIVLQFDVGYGFESTAKIHSVY
jgi:hypothetical protein